VLCIRVLAKNLDDPYYEPTIVVHDIYHLSNSMVTFGAIPT